MRRGTKSLLFGCHQVIIHPIFVLVGWIVLYGWSSLTLSVLTAILIHDWGYWQCHSMDGDDGIMHPIRLSWLRRISKPDPYDIQEEVWYHSRHLCKMMNRSPSRLCWADKLGTAMMPSWLWAIQAWASGEGFEYMENIHGHDYNDPEPMNLLGLVRFHVKYKRLWGRYGTRWGRNDDMSTLIGFVGPASDRLHLYDSTTHRGL